MNMLNYKLNKDSLLYSRKRKTTTKTIFITIFAIFISLIAASLLATAFGYDPFDLIARLFSEGFKDINGLFFYICIFALSGMAFSFAFKAGVFNMGISGQMYGAGVAVLAVTKTLENVPFPPFVGQLFTLIIAMGTGTLIAMFIGILEKHLKVNPIVSAIILNWIIFLAGFFIIGTFFSPAGSNAMVHSVDIPPQFTLQDPTLGGWIPSIIVVLIIAITIWILTKYTVFGHKIKSTGLSIEGSKYAGYNVSAIKLATFAISGAIAGILAVVLYTSRTPNIPASTLNINVPFEGFNGIAIGLMASNNPIGIIFVSCLLGLFKASSSSLLPPPTFNEVILGLVMLGAAMTVVFYKLKPQLFILRKRFSPLIDEDRSNYENKIDSLLSKYKSINNTKKEFDKNYYKKNKFKLTYNNFKVYCRKNDIDKIHNKIIILILKNKFLKSNINKEYREFSNEQYKKYNKSFIKIQLNYKTNIIKLQIDRYFNPKDIISNLQDKTKIKFDDSLNKYISKQKDKIEKIKIRLPNKNNDEKIIKLNTKISNSILDNNKYKEDEFIKIGKKYSKSINDISRIKKIELYLKSEINKYIKDEITRKKLENKVDLHINHLEENLLGGNIC